MKIINYTLILCMFIFTGCKNKTTTENICAQTELEQTTEESEILKFIQSINDEEGFAQFYKKEEVLEYLLSMTDEEEIARLSEQSEVLAHILWMRYEVRDRVVGYIETRHAFPPSDYIPAEIELYELKEKYYPMFDSIISRSINNPVNRTKKLGFIVYVSLNSKNDENGIVVYLENHWKLDIDLDDAIFYYKGFQFNYFGDFFGDMVEKKGIKTLYKVNPDLFRFGVIDESYGGSWIYGIKDDGEIVFEKSNIFDFPWD